MDTGISPVIILMDAKVSCVHTCIYAMHMCTHALTESKACHIRIPGHTHTQSETQTHTHSHTHTHTQDMLSKLHSRHTIRGKYLEEENIGEFGEFVAIYQIFTLQMS